MALVQTKSGNGGGYVNTFNLAFDSNVTGGNFLVLAVTLGANDTLASITDGLGNTWTHAVTASNADDRQTLIYYVVNAVAGATTVTFTANGGQFPDWAVIMREESGVATTTPLDKTAGQSTGDGVTSHASGNTATTTQATELLVGAVGCTVAAPTYAGDAAWADLASQGGFDSWTSTAMQRRVVSSTAAYGITMTATSSANGQAVIATFKETVVAEDIVGPFPTHL